MTNEEAKIITREVVFGGTNKYTQEEITEALQTIFGSIKNKTNEHSTQHERRENGNT